VALPVTAVAGLDVAVTVPPKSLMSRLNAVTRLESVVDKEFEEGPAAPVVAAPWLFPKSSIKVLSSEIMPCRPYWAIAGVLDPAPAVAEAVVTGVAPPAGLVVAAVPAAVVPVAGVAAAAAAAVVPAPEPVVVVVVVAGAAGALSVSVRSE
jgi:hypothetical protein